MSVSQMRESTVSPAVSSATIDPRVQSAIDDLELVKSLLDPRLSDRSSATAVRSEMKIVGLLFAASAVFIGWEVFGEGTVTASFLSSTGDREVQIYGLASILLGLSFIGGGVYFLAWRRAHEISARMSRTLARDFPYLAIRSFLPDLAAKFTLLAIALIANQPRLVGPMLLAFTADYVMQGRFFDLPRVVRMVTAVGLLALAVQSAASGNPAILHALVAFAAISLASLIRGVVRLAGK